MSIKLHEYPNGNNGRLFVFHCPGCGYDHGFHVGSVDRPTWEWNGSMDAPTFTPSLLCNKEWPANRCHLFVTDGKIQFQPDCFHKLAGQTVEMPDWEE
jgi:hypothetical protein